MPIGDRLTRRAKHHIQLVSSLIGVDPRRILAWRHAGRYLRDLRSYGRQSPPDSLAVQWRNLWPILSDLDDQAGVGRGHYFHQDLWAARKIYARRPEVHMDVGSRIDGFVAHVLAFMPVLVLDVRPLASKVQGLTFVQGNAQNLSGFATGSMASLSSLHAIEHFGLGRYGDPIDPHACFAAMRELARVLQVDGRLYFSVPIGRERTEFNAQRVFSPATILSAFAQLSLVSFSGVDDAGDLQSDVEPREFEGADYACGLFEFTKTGG